MTDFLQYVVVARVGQEQAGHLTSYGRVQADNLTSQLQQILPVDCKIIVFYSFAGIAYEYGKLIAEGLHATYFVATHALGQARDVFFHRNEPELASQLVEQYKTVAQVIILVTHAWTASLIPLSICGDAGFSVQEDQEIDQAEAAVIDFAQRSVTYLA